MGGFVPVGEHNLSKMIFLTETDVTYVFKEDINNGTQTKLKTLRKNSTNTENGKITK